LPGGKVEINEGSHETAARELKEETGLCGRRWQKLGEAGHPYPDRNLKFILFSCLCPDTSGLQTETECMWIPGDKLGDYPMPEANARLLPLLEAWLEEKS